jgi:hypothetical protein
MPHRAPARPDGPRRRLGLAVVDLRRFFHRDVVFFGAFTPRQISFEVVRTDEIFDVQKCGAFLPDVDEGRLHSGQNPGHLAENDVAEGTSRAGTLNMELRDDSFFDESHARLSQVHIDDEKILGHFGTPFRATGTRARELRPSARRRRTRRPAWQRCLRNTSGGSLPAGGVWKRP